MNFILYRVGRLYTYVFWEGEVPTKGMTDPLYYGLPPTAQIILILPEFSRYAPLILVNESIAPCPPSPITQAASTPASSTSETVAPERPGPSYL